MNISNGLTSGLTSTNVHSQSDDGRNVPSDVLADASAESSQDAIDVLPPSNEEPQDEQPDWQRIALRWVRNCVREPVLFYYFTVSLYICVICLNETTTANFAH